MATLSWWGVLVAKTVVLLLGGAGAVVFWILTDMARDPQVGGSVPVLFGVTVGFVIVGVAGLLAVVADLRQVVSASSPEA